MMSNTSDFVIEDGVLEKYKGSGGEVVIPDGVTSIGSHAFWSCYSLTSVIIQEGVTSIGEDAFRLCTSLANVIIPEGVTSIGRCAFWHCSNLTSVVIPVGVTNIGDSAFEYCSRLTSVVIPEGVISIGRSAFEYCSRLTSVVIPDSVTSIGERAFYGCKDILDNQGFKTIGNVLLEYTGKDEEAVIPDGLRIIHGDAFQGNINLTSVSISTSVKLIGISAFKRCRSLTRVVIPEGVTSIGEWAFSGCRSLTSVVIPESVMSIGEGAFSDCSALQELIVPQKLKSLGKEPFGDQFPEALRPKIGTFYHALTDGALKSYILVSNIWESLDEGLQTEIFLTRQGKPLMQAYGECIKAHELNRIGNAVLERIQGKKPTSKECTAAANYMVLFYENAPLDLLKQLYDGLKKPKTGTKALKSVEEHVALMEKLGNAIEVDQSLPEIERRVMEHLLAEKMNVKDLEAKLKSYYGLEYSDLSVLCGQDGNKLKPVVLAWLLMAHETQAKWWDSILVKAALEKPGLNPEAAKIVAMLNQESVQAALMALADEYLVQYQSTKKKFLCFPICRYADETTMAELTKRAPKWSTSVSGNDAPPLCQMREAVRYSDTRAAMSFAERYHELDKYAALRGMTEDEMRDKYLSDVGLDEQGGKTYDLGNQTVTARLQQDLSYLFELSNGKTMKSLPKKGADGEKYKAAKADYDEMRKATKKILKSRGQVLFQDFLSGRERGAIEWQEAYLKNPLLRKAASLIVWAQGDKTFTLRDGSPIDSSEQPYTITDAPIQVAHPMEMKTNDTAAWQKYFNAHGLKQPFVQVWEPVIDPAMIREDRYEGSVLTVYRFVNMDKHGIHSGSLHAYSEDIEFTLDGCNLDHEASVWRIIPDLEQELTYTLGKFSFDQYTRKVNHIVSLLDKWTVKERVSKDDISVMDLMDRFTLAQITEFIAAAQEANAVNVLAELLEYKNNKFSDFDPMEEFTLEW